jgi:hypothetical protein
MIRRPNTLHPNRPLNRATSADTTGVPGLGFDFVHFAATHPNRPNPFNRRRNPRDFAAFFPFFDGGFFLPSSPFIGDDSGVDEQQQEVVADEDASQAPLHARMRAQEEVPAPVISRDSIPEPQRPTEEYVFVRRDGTVFFAVAYAWDSGTLRYVTTEGLRRSVARDSLDLNATQQFNEQRGMNFHLPA